MKSYLGLDVPDDAQGVLQDIHWSSGMLGYFPTYSLGNIISCQIWEKALAAMPDLYDQFERGEFIALREWLREALHKHGRKFTPTETLAKVVSGPISVRPYVNYLKSKLGDTGMVFYRFVEGGGNDLTFEQRASHIGDFFGTFADETDDNVYIVIVGGGTISD